MKFKKNDILLSLAILFLALLLLVSYRVFFRRQGDYVTVTVGGQQYTTLPLDTDTSISIPGIKGSANTLNIREGYADMTDATCPDRLCVHQKKVRCQGESLVCLPNQVIVTVTSEKEPPLDDVAH